MYCFPGWEGSSSRLRQCAAPRVIPCELLLTWIRRTYSGTPRASALAKDPKYQFADGDKGRAQMVGSVNPRFKFGFNWSTPTEPLANWPSAREKFFRKSMISPTDPFRESRSMLTLLPGNGRVGLLFWYELKSY